MIRLQIELGSDFRQAVNEASQQGARLRRGASAGLLAAVQTGAAVVVRDYLSGQSLRARSGALRRKVDGWLDGDLEGAVGVREPSGVGAYSWLLTDEEKTIRPVKGKFLAIPIGENLTGAGVARFSSPRQVPDGFFVSTNGRLLFGRRNGKKGRFRALFTLVTSVTVQGSGALADGVTDAVDDMTAAVQAGIDKELRD